MSRSHKAGLQFPIGRIARFLKAGKYAERVGGGAPVYLSTVLEYLAAEVLELAGNAAREEKSKQSACSEARSSRLLRDPSSREEKTSNRLAVENWTGQ